MAALNSRYPQLSEWSKPEPSSSHCLQDFSRTNANNVNSNSVSPTDVNQRRLTDDQERGYVESTIHLKNISLCCTI
jgi:hypothetical protein